MYFKSTRDPEGKGVSFSDAILSGFAPDGGLYVPDSIPVVSSEQLESWSKLSFPDLFTQVLGLYITDFGSDGLRTIVNNSFTRFDTTNVVEVAPVSATVAGNEVGFFICELWHGPTLAFKDIGLQFLANCMEKVLAHRKQTINLLVATSGDTGSAALEAFAGRQGVNITVLFPEGKISEVQALQMTTVTDANCFVYSVSNANSDILDEMCAEMFEDKELQANGILGTVNSFNIARVLAQIVHYFYVYFQIKAASSEDKKVRIVVPSGAFGNGMAGVLAKKMGLPIDLHATSNCNDTLFQLISKGVYRHKEPIVTIAPSMDINNPYNMERLMYYMFEENGETTRNAMAEYRSPAGLTLPQAVVEKIAGLVTAETADEEHVKSAMINIHDSCGYVLDPHTAVGVAAVLENLGDASYSTAVLATANPSKFEESVTTVLKTSFSLHDSIQDIRSKESRQIQLDAKDVAVLREHLSTRF